jgi:hypothetical protein
MPRPANPIPAVRPLATRRLRLARERRQRIEELLVIHLHLGQMGTKELFLESVRGW